MKLILVALLASTAMASKAVPLSPTNWKALNTSVTLSGNGVNPGTKLSAFYYDLEGKRMKHVYPNGKQSVYRYDQTDPGESWSRAYVWTTGKEATCCYVNLCTGGPCHQGEQSRMAKVAVDKRATDDGPSGASNEAYHHTMKLFGQGSVQEWLVDRNTSAVVSWTSNVTIKKIWVSSVSLYGGLVIGNLTVEDFAYPRMCTTNMCEQHEVRQTLAL